MTDAAHTAVERLARKLFELNYPHPDDTWETRPQMREWRLKEAREIIASPAYKWGQVMAFEELKRQLSLVNNSVEGWMEFSQAIFQQTSKVLGDKND